MTLEQRFTKILELLPKGASVTLTRDDICSLVDFSTVAEECVPTIGTVDWLTAKQVAKAIGRSPSRVRDLRSVHFPNAKWNGKEYMIPLADVETYLNWRMSAYTPPKTKKEKSEVAQSSAWGAAGASATSATSASNKPTNLSGWKNKQVSDNT